MAAPTAISTRQLARLIGTPGAPALIDIRTDPDFDEDPVFIPGAIRHPHTDIGGLRARIGDQPCIIICQKGKKLSQAVVSWLIGDGHIAEYLDGGMFAWRDMPDPPCVPHSALPDPVDGSTLWVTRYRPKIDRIACPWLIRRFVDPNARFLFVAPTEVHGVTEQFSATPFDVEDVFWSHHGDNCTFDLMLDQFGLRIPVLDRLSTVIRAADTNRHELAPEAAGLLAISVGLSRQYKNDHQQLEVGMQLYDALYRWARDGFDEGHDWPTDRRT